MKEIRCVEVRALDAAADGTLSLEGTPIVFNTVATINDPAGSFNEVIKPGAVDAAALQDSRLFYNHDTSRVPLARTPKTMQFTVTPVGVNMRATLPNTESGREVWEAVRRGDLNGMSFAFKVAEGGSRYYPNSNLREITRIAKILEVSVVNWPAYQSASVEARAQMTEAETEQYRQALLIRLSLPRRIHRE